MHTSVMVGLNMSSIDSVLKSAKVKGAVKAGVDLWFLCNKDRFSFNVAAVARLVWNWDRLIGLVTLSTSISQKKQVKKYN